MRKIAVHAPEQPPQPPVTEAEARLDLLGQEDDAVLVEPVGDVVLTVEASGDATREPRRDPADMAALPPGGFFV